jgi:hypothetical protein
MAISKKNTKAGSGKSQIKVRDMQPPKDPKGGARHVESPKQGNRRQSQATGR